MNPLTKTIFGTILVLLSMGVQALSNTGRVPILLYHSWMLADNSGECTSYAKNAHVALQSDLETIRNQGFVVVPVYWIAQWAIGDLDGSALPEKVVGITFDDGFDLDWIDNTTGMAAHPCYGQLNSLRTVLQQFKTTYSATLPWYSPHASNFVIGSPTARSQINPGGMMADSWWTSANASGIMEIYNHSGDHDHDSITSPFYEQGTWFPAGGQSQGNFFGINQFCRINSRWEAYTDIYLSANYISGKISPAWADLFAYPFGHVPPYVRDTYFQNYWSEHQTYAAFSTELATPGPYLPNYTRRASNRYSLPRLTYQSSWNSPAGLINILNAASSATPPISGSAVDWCAGYVDF
ncbi:MAG: polysaccharide deacetylase family protein [Phycisphaeraceae bacterium]|nr:polysaccharide deacetylase family protein [Phycisphaeraceae bacterium]